MTDPRLLSLLEKTIEYAPDSGVFSWLWRSARVYCEFVDGMSNREAEKKAKRFNQVYAFRAVHLFPASNGGRSRLRISLGTKCSTFKVDALVAAWALSCGRFPRPGLEIIPLNGDYMDFRKGNLVEVSKPLRWVINNPMTGIVRLRNGSYSWALRLDNKRYRSTGEVYNTPDEAICARLLKLKELGAFHKLTLER